MKVSHNQEKLSQWKFPKIKFPEVSVLGDLDIHEALENHLGYDLEFFSVNFPVSA